jgi:hypothetical protein
LNGIAPGGGVKKVAAQLGSDRFGSVRIDSTRCAPPVQGNRTMKIFMPAETASGKGKDAAKVDAGPDLAGAAVLA